MGFPKHECRIYYKAVLLVCIVLARCEICLVFSHNTFVCVIKTQTKRRTGGKEKETFGIYYKSKYKYKMFKKKKWIKIWKKSQQLKTYFWSISPN